MVRSFERIASLKMRLFVACKKCNRKYQVAEEKIGKRLRCHCGHLLEVRPSRGHDAQVIRCSSCGAAREGGRNRCGFCDADFTLHERDLHTVCPKCMARVSDRARHCQHCGTRLAGEQIVEDVSKLGCPVCGPSNRLSHRKLGRENVGVLECSFCAGLWLGVSAFEQLQQRMRRESERYPRLKRAKPGPVSMRKQAGPKYRLCIHCGKHMNRQQYARGCGVVIDICFQHGIWFDDQELHQVLDWIARGGRRKKRKLQPRRTVQATGLPIAEAEARAMPLERRPARAQVATAPKRPSDFVDLLVQGLFQRLTELF